MKERLRTFASIGPPPPKEGEKTEWRNLSGRSSSKGFTTSHSDAEVLLDDGGVEVVYRDPDGHGEVKLLIGAQSSAML